MSDLDALEAQLALDRAALADRIFARLDTPSSSSSSSSKAPAPFQHRPPTLGLGAKAGVDQGVSKLSVEDARLKGRLGKKAVREEGNGKRKAVEDEEDDEDESREVKGAASKRKKADPFAVKAKLVKPAVKTTTTQAVGDAGATANQPSAESTIDASPAPLSKSQRKKLAKKRRLEEERANGVDKGSDANDADESAKDVDASSSAPVATTSSSFTPAAELPQSSASSAQRSAHQQSLHAKLQGAQFRQLNEELYTSASHQSFAAAQQDPSRMQAYHDGFREQVKKWPSKPYERCGQAVLKAVKRAEPLVVDLGAGEGPLSRYLGDKARVAAYDLLDTADGVVRGVDCARRGGVPLPGTLAQDSPAIADAAVFCLSLMGTDWVGMVLEARRVLRPRDGRLVIAEVSSRLSSADEFVNVVEKCGFELMSKDEGNTHFILFSFKTKLGSVDAGRDEAAREELMEEGRRVLQPCLYKRR